jgi:glycosyltransferase involved in cell wall biosynthesis
MAAAVLALAQDIGRRKALGEAARARAVADWDREALLSAFESELRAAVGKT